jgi:hypothetical protein
MRWIRRVSTWTTSVVLITLFSFALITEIDPTDDFSLILPSSSKLVNYRLITEYRVAEILSDRLDRVPQSQIPRLSKHLVCLCEHYRFDPAFILSLIEVESGFHVKAKSPVGALGLMQVMLPTANYVVRELEFKFSGYEYFKNITLEDKEITAEVLLEPFVNTAIGMAYLAWLRDNYENSYHTLAAYNLGPGRIDQLLARKSFQPVIARKYFQAIRKKYPDFRFYQRATFQKKPSLSVPILHSS